ncbi:MAG TPA: NRDE family protein [Gammaproteobacteria bacterium]|nr:NRDE family protein [Gammaproteobacteria bacterium]
MCLVLIAKNIDPAYPLIILFNRDEYYSRPTIPLSRWPNTDIYAGRDALKQGTWLGVNAKGRWGLLTNYRQGVVKANQLLSRGNLVREFLASDLTIKAYLENVHLTHAEYNGFNLICGDQQNLFYYSSALDTYQPLASGLYGLSNALLDTPWSKVERAKQLFKQLLSNRVVTLENCLELLADRMIAPDSTLPATGIDVELERQHSAIFVASAVRGTCSSSVIFVDAQGQGQFVEKTFSNSMDKGKVVKLSFVWPKNADGLLD